MRIVGILNVTADSFSDGGRWLETDAALAHALEMLAGGADMVDVGAESSNPSGRRVEPAEQIRRLEPIVRALKAEGAAVSVDTHRPEVMDAALRWGVDMINDVTALRDPAAVEVLRESDVPVVVMHARNTGYRAEQAAHEGRALDDAITFLRRRVDELDRAGIAETRLLLDPGMGFFLSSRPEASLDVLRGLERLKETGRPVYVSPSRKSFLGGLLGDRPPSDRAAGTLAAEIWAATHGADYIRTHEPRALRDALTVWGALEAGG